MVLLSWETFETLLSGETSETMTSVTAAGHVFFMVTDTSLPDVRGTGATCLPHGLVSGITLEEAVAVTVIRPVVSGLAGRKLVGVSGRWRTRRHSGEDRGEDDGHSWEMHFDLCMLGELRRTEEQWGTGRTICLYSDSGRWCIRCR